MGNITFEVPLFLKHLAEDLQSLNVEGGTVGECLEDFLRQFPSGRKFLFDEKGKFFGHIDIYVNGVSTFPEELTRPVREGDTITMLYLIDGG